MTTWRVAIVGGDAASWYSLASRLRAVFLVPAAEAHEVVIFVGSPWPDKATLERALGDGKHVFIAATPYLSWFDLNPLYITTWQSGLHFAFVNPDRYLPSRQLIKEQIGGKLGAAGLVRLHRWESGAEPSPALRLPGALLGDLDLACWLVGALPNQLFALGQEDRYVQVHLGFPGGAMALLDYTNLLPAGDGYQSLSVIAASGAAYADDHQNMHLVYGGGQPRAVRTDETARQRTAILQEFEAALISDQALWSDTWHDIFFLGHTVLQSLVVGKAVSLENGP